MTTTNSVLEIGIHIVEKCATSASEHLVNVSYEKQTKNVGLCSGLARRDSTDDIYAEYENDFPSDSTSWKRQRPPLCNSVIKSAFIVFRVVLLTGCFFAILENVLVFIALNTFGLCDWREDADERLNEVALKTKRISEVLGAFFLDHYMFFILCTVFTWSAVKQTRVIVVNTLSAFADVLYRVFLICLNMYHTPYIPYPLNVLYIVTILHHGYTMGRKVVPQCKVAALKVSVKLCIHLASVLLTAFLMIYAIFPWFITLHGIPKLLVATFAPLLFLPSKLLGRLCVLRLDGVIHPSTGFALVSMIHAVESVVARAMQADLAGLKMFVIYGVLHGANHVLETLIVIMLDKNCKVNKKASIVFGYSENTTARSSRVKRRLAADMTLQTMLYESAAITVATGYSQLYALVYQPLLSPDQGTEIITQLLTYIFIALFTEFLFHTLSVLLQTRYLNVPVGRVWERKWRFHLWVSIITTLMCIVYFTSPFQPIMKEKYKSDGDFVFNETCTMSF